VRNAIPEATPDAPDFVAVVSSRVSKVIASDFDGKVVRMLVRNDQFVRKDDIVAQLDVAELRAKLTEAEGQRARAAGEAGRASAAAADAMQKARIEQRLMIVGAGTPNGYQTALQQARGASAGAGGAASEIKAIDAQIAEYKRLIATADIKAPIDGTISGVKVRESEVAHKGVAMARVFDQNDLVVKFSLPRELEKQVTPGQHVQMYYDGEQHLDATVLAIKDDHDPAISFLVVEAVFDNSAPRPEGVHVGIAGRVRIASRNVASPAGDKGVVR
jgi:RND family efflux transporter MFP subunit